MIKITPVSEKIDAATCNGCHARNYKSDLLPDDGPVVTLQKLVVGPDGGNLTIALNLCPACLETLQERVTAALKVECPLCKGSGKTFAPSFRHHGTQIERTCHTCKGSGKV